MKRLLLCLTALLLTFTAFAQVPANDLIENAIQIDPTNYLEENIRLDLATTSGFQNALCGTGTFNKVFYKFTASADITISASVTDMNGNSITQSFVIVYTAPNLIQTDESQLSLSSDCVFGESTRITLVAGQNYYISVYRQDANALSRFTTNVPPSNDTIENAIEITASNFSDDDVRIDLAAPNLGGQINCPLTGFNTVYYKFTALATGPAEVFLISNTSLGNTFAIIYAAADLNATNNNQLTLSSTCAFGGQVTNFNVVEGQSYYIIVHRDVPNSPTRVAITTPQNVPTSERDALIDLYNSADGPNWNFNTNWNTTAPVSTWENVLTENGHVIQVGFQGGTGGFIPNSILNLPFLKFFFASDNNLTGEIPDFGSLADIENVGLQRNNFSFADFEPNYASNSTIETFFISPQNDVDSPVEFEPIIGQDYDFTMTTVPGTNVEYQWYRTFEADLDPDSDPVVGANTNVLTLNNIQPSDLDNYVCFATSASVPGLTIKRAPVNLTGEVSQQERDALIAFYNALDGDNWTDNTNWLSNEPVETWSHIIKAGNKVVGISIFGDINMNGVFPDEIGDLVNLKVLNIAINTGITGPIPNTIGNLSNLERLRLQFTGNTGVIPSSVGNLSNLRELRIVATGMTGELPTTLGNLSSLTDMTLFGERVFAGNGQSFTGTIPASLGNLSNLVILDLRGNSFNGEVPNSLSNLINLRDLFLSDNDLLGILPDFSGNLNPARRITVENNFFDFSDLEPLVNNGVEYTFLSYSPQRTQDQEEEITSPPGVDIVLDVNDTNIDRNVEDTAMDNEYQWFKDDVAISGANASTYTIVNAQPTDSGIYYCEITNPLLPDLTIVRANITVTVEDNLSTEDFENGEFKLFPNPATDWISIQTKSGTDAKAQVFDVNGKLLFERQLSAEITAIAIDQLAAGMYLISVTTDTMKTTKRFIKQ